MKFNWSEVLTATMVLFAVIDIIGALPIILEIKRRAGNIKPLRTTLVALGIMVSFLFLGESILKVIGIEVNSFAVAGSFVLFAMAMEMILGIQIFKDDGSSPKTASIVPLAFPIIAGAGTMTSLVSLRAEYAFVNIVVAIAINLMIVFVVLKATGWLEKLLGPTGIAVVRKVFGIILLAIAVKLFSANIKELFV